MKFITLIIFITYSASTILAQSKIKKIKFHDAKAFIKLVYYVQSNNENVKNGQYSLYYKDTLRAKGQYTNNMKTGEWVYTPVKYFKISGHYINDLMDGKWIYIKDDDTLSVVNFSNGLLNGKQLGFYGNNKIKYESYFQNGERDTVRKIFYENGSIKEVQVFDLNYNRFKERLFHSPEGTPICKLIYFEGHPNSLFCFNMNDSSNIFEGNLLNGNGNIKEYYIDGTTHKKQLLSIRNYKDSLLDGRILLYNINGEIKCKGQYLKGVLVDLWEFYDANGKLDHMKAYLFEKGLTKDSTEVSTIHHCLSNNFYQDYPHFPDGENKFLKYICENVTYPDECKDNGITGRVIVKFIVDKTGCIENVRVEKKVNPLLDIEAERVVRMQPNWTPGFQYGIPVKVEFEIPINFNLY